MTKDRLCKLSEHLGSKIMTSEQGEKKEGKRKRGRGEEEESGRTGGKRRIKINDEEEDEEEEDPSHMCVEADITAHLLYR